ncbi:MAG: hypothetical protein HY060_01430, partial [Proteobacteria bacterium]|nr:hypothetical protein [Pseudomonadota bacterium]
CEEKCVKRSDGTVVARDGLCGGIDFLDAHAKPQLNPIFVVPVERVQNNVVGSFFAGKDRRKQNPVVIDVRFFAEDGDVEFRRVLQYLFDAGNAARCTRGASRLATSPAIGFVKPAEKAGAGSQD